MAMPVRGMQAHHRRGCAHTGRESNAVLPSTPRGMGHLYSLERPSSPMPLSLPRATLGVTVTTTAAAKPA